jgi:hypothetical protein
MFALQKPSVFWTVFKRPLSDPEQILPHGLAAPSGRGIILGLILGLRTVEHPGRRWNQDRRRPADHFGRMHFGEWVIKESIGAFSLCNYK